MGAGAGAGAHGVSLVIRPASPNDLDAVLAIERSAFSDPWNRPAFAALVGRPESVFLVATRPAGPGKDERVVGFAVAFFAADQGDLSNLAVDEAYRRDGVGRALLEAVMASGRARGALDLWLEVRASNSAARSMYERLGFREAGVRRQYYSAPVEDAMVMQRLLGAARE